MTNEATNKPEETSKSGQKRVFFSNDKDRSRSDSSKRPKDDARRDGQDGRKNGGQSSIAYLSAMICKCDDADRTALSRKCCFSINGACVTAVHVLLDTGSDPISFVNRKVAAWIRTQRALGKLVTEKPVDFVGFDNVVEFNKTQQNDDNVVKAYKDLFS